MSVELSVSEVGQQIYFVRNNRIMIDSDLALLYEIETFNLNKAVKRNQERFPEDFMYQLTQEEWISLTSQIGISKKKGRGGRRTPPYGFTQEGVAMLSSVLNSRRACQVNIIILRAFAKFRHQAESTTQLSEKIEHLESSVNQQLAAMANTIQQLVPLAETKIVPVTSMGTPTSYSNNLYRGRNNSTVEAILDAVAEYYQISVANLKAPTRIPTIANPRQICMYLIRKYSGLSYKSIGAIFGGKDHTTILHAFRKIEVWISTDTDIAEALRSIQKILETKGITRRTILA